MRVGALSPDRSAGDICGARWSRSSCGVQQGDRRCHGQTNDLYINALLCFAGGQRKTAGRT